jgi:hypothetical protein
MGPRPTRNVSPHRSARQAQSGQDQTRQAANPALLADRTPETDSPRSRRRGVAAYDCCETTSRNARQSAPARTPGTSAPPQRRPHGMGPLDASERAHSASHSRTLALRDQVKRSRDQSLYGPRRTHPLKSPEIFLPPEPVNPPRSIYADN